MQYYIWQHHLLFNHSSTAYAIIPTLEWFQFWVYLDKVMHVLKKSASLLIKINIEEQCYNGTALHYHKPSCNKIQLHHLPSAIQLISVMSHCGIRVIFLLLFVLMLLFVIQLPKTIYQICLSSTILMLIILSCNLLYDKFLNKVRAYETIHNQWIFCAPVWFIQADNDVWSLLSRNRVIFHLFHCSTCALCNSRKLTNSL